MTQDDSHSYVTPEQAPAEIKHLLDFVLGLLKDFGLDDFYLELSTRDDSRPDKFVGSDEDWATATKVPRGCRCGLRLELVPDPGGAAFYGPKISVQCRDAIGRTWQMSTIQYDFNQPKASTRLPGRRRVPPAAGDDPRQVRLHRAVLRRPRRALRRRLPPWLAPVQVRRSRSRRRTPTTCTTSRGGCGAGSAGGGGRLRRPDAEEDPQRPAAEGAVHFGDCRERRHRGRSGVVPLPRRPPRTTACPSRRRSRVTAAVASREQV